MNKYKNALTKELLKEFRKFQKWAPENCYVMNGDQEAEFNKRIKQIIRHHEIIRKVKI